MRSWIVTLIFTSAVYSVSNGWAEQYTFFRSDGGQSKSPDRLVVHFDRSDTTLWRQPLSAGHSTPCISGERIFLTTYDQERQELATVACDLASGRPLWKRKAPATRMEEVHRVGSPAAATIASDGDRVFVFFGSYGLLCYDHDGNRVWSRPLGPFQDEFGAASSPVLLGDTLYLNQDHDTNNFLLALNTQSGRTRWEVTRNEFTRSYATPVVFESGPEQQIVVAGALTLTGYAPKTGKRLWWMHGLARIVNTTPAIHDDVLYVATWSPGGDVGERITMDSWSDAIEQYDKNDDRKISRDELPLGPVLTRFFRIDLDQDQGIDQPEWEKQAQVFQRADNAIIAVRPRGHGELGENQILWRYAKGIPYVASPLYHNGHIYLVKDGGILTVLDAETGKVRKRGRLKGRGNYYASPIAAAGKIYFASEQGVVTVVSADSEWKILSSHDFGEPIYATPVARLNRIYIRTAEAMYCFAGSPN
ncbi:MAG: PQQ-binding-like beta-propeller repeat protein [Pirellulaceae bacterium]|nr:PQQ-binding-like beta-propeller repeat protein [Pirellulaceae bacterium]